MKQAKIKAAVIEALQSNEAQQIIGDIVISAMNQALTREIRFEDGKTEPGRVVEKTEKCNILDFIAKYFPHVEASIRGCQSDAAQARNRSASVLAVLRDIEDRQLPNHTLQAHGEAPRMIESGNGADRG